MEDNHENRFRCDGRSCPLIIPIRYVVAFLLSPVLIPLAIFLILYVIGSILTVVEEFLAM